MAQNPEQFKTGRMETCKGEVVAKRYLFPKRFITIRSKGMKRELPDEQREQLSSLRMREQRRIDFTVRNKEQEPQIGK